MPLPPTNCPLCNSVQRLSPKRRLTGGKIEVFFVCHTCKEEFVATTVTHEDLKARRKFIRERNRRIRRD